MEQNWEVAEEGRAAAGHVIHKGALPVRSVHLYCDGRSLLNQLHIRLRLILLFPSLECQTNYHHNFRVKNGICTYYDGIIPAIIQVGEHQFADQQLVQLWIALMLVSWQVLILCNLCSTS